LMDHFLGAPIEEQLESLWCHLNSEKRILLAASSQLWFWNKNFSDSPKWSSDGLACKHS